MAWYAVYQVADGTLVSIGSRVPDSTQLSKKGLASKAFAFDPRNGYTWNPVTLAFDAVARRRAPISTQAFFDRFTDAELGAIIDARDNGADPQVRLILKAFFERLWAANEVHLDSQRVADGLAFLEAQGLIAAGRAAEIRS